MTAWWLAGQDDRVAVSVEALNEITVTQPFKLNNVALKWIRDSHEHPRGDPSIDFVDLTGTDPLEIGVIEKDRGMDYRFKAGETTPWSWRQMLAGMTPAAKDLVLGCDPRLGVARLFCAPVDGAYDHKRWHAALHIGRPFDAGAKVPVWDFWLERTDGSVVRFHTSYSNNKVEVATLGDPPGLPRPPKHGKGRSDGQGTYKAKTSGNYTTNSRKVVKATHGGGDAAAAAQGQDGGTGADGAQEAQAAQANHGGGIGLTAAQAAQANHGGGDGDYWHEDYWRDGEGGSGWW